VTFRIRTSFDPSPNALNHSKIQRSTETPNMSALLHGPNPGAENEPPENPAIQARNARLGLRLFAVYGLIYGLYVVVGAFMPGVMNARLAGVNVAVVWGFGLIVLAFLMALVYGWLCNRPLAESQGEGSR